MTTLWTLDRAYFLKHALKPFNFFLGIIRALLHAFLCSFQVDLPIPKSMVQDITQCRVRFLGNIRQLNHPKHIMGLTFRLI